MAELRLVQEIQWYRVDDWGNTELIDGATNQEYIVMALDVSADSLHMRLEHQVSYGS